MGHATKQEHIQRFTIQQNDQKPTIVHFRPMASKVDSLGMSNTIRSVVLSYYWFLLLPFLRIQYKMIENLSLRSSNLDPSRPPSRRWSRTGSRSPRRHPWRWPSPWPG